MLNLNFVVVREPASWMIQSALSRMVWLLELPGRELAPGLDASLTGGPPDLWRVLREMQYIQGVESVSLSISLIHIYIYNMYI